MNTYSELLISPGHIAEVLTSASLPELKALPGWILCDGNNQGMVGDKLTQTPNLLNEEVEEQREPFDARLIYLMKVDP